MLAYIVSFNKYVENPNIEGDTFRESTIFKVFSNRKSAYSFVRDYLEMWIRDDANNSFYGESYSVVPQAEELYGIDLSTLYQFFIPYEESGHIHRMWFTVDCYKVED